VADQSYLEAVAWDVALRKAMASSPGLQTQAALASKSGVSQSTIGRILRREGNPASAKIERIAKALGMSLVDLANMARDDEVDKQAAGRPNAFNPPQLVRLISWVQAGAFVEAVDNYPPGDAEDWVALPTGRCGPKTFALRVIGESMEPDYQNGDIIFVDPDVTAEQGKAVVVCLDERNEVTFKKLVIDGQRRYLRPLNPSWQTQIIDLSPDARIVGVVIGRWGEK
jgi:SOS-response transcriptional repressor LexA